MSAFENKLYFFFYSGVHPVQDPGVTQVRGLQSKWYSLCG